MKRLFKYKRILIVMFVIGLIISYKYINSKELLDNNKEIVDIILNNTFNSKPIYTRIINSKMDFNKSLRLLNNDYEKVINEEVKSNNPVIYLYNSHPTEEYAQSSLGEYILRPTVIMNNYIMEDIFNKNGYLTYVEEKSTKDYLNNNNLNYASSYIASRSFLESIKNTYPSLKYFIDIHRDSLDKSRTTITINDRSYAKILFIIGLENPNYNDNLIFTEKLNNKINELYPGLSKGIYKKEGIGVNGVYNQDFSPYTILVEIGGYDNTSLEVLNTSVAFSKCFMEIINEEDH